MRRQAAESLRAGVWGIQPDERHRDELAPGDRILLYLGGTERVFVGCAVLASGVHPWTPAESRAYPGDAAAGVSLEQIEEWEPPVPMDAVLAQIAPSEGARAELPAGLVGITPAEYAAAHAVASRR